MEDKNCKKLKISQWAINIIVMMIFSAYAWIFSNITGRLTAVENKIENLNPTLTQIQTDLAEIKTNILWLKDKQNTK